MRALPVLLILLALAGCSPNLRTARVSEAAILAETALQKRQAVETEFARRRQLVDVVYRLARAAAPECGGGRPLAGLELGGIGLFQSPHAPAAQEIGFGTAVRITAVAADSPAWRAGARPEDELVAINGQAVAQGRAAYRDAGWALAEALEAGPVVLGLARAGQRLEARFGAERGCPLDIYLTREALPTPKANGKAILIPNSFMRLARPADELAAIVAFLVAYNVRGLADTGTESLLTVRRDLSVLVGEGETTLYQPPLALDGLGVKEADRYAMELLKRAQFHVGKTVILWRRYLMATPALEEDIHWGRHLLGPTRLVRMQAWADGREP